MLRASTLIVLLLLLAVLVRSVPAQEGCCSCTGEGRSGCSGDPAICNDPDAATACTEMGGTFMPFTAGQVCSGTMADGQCIAAGAAAPALSPAAIALLFVVLAGLGYLTMVRRRSAA
jgi:hypothetical protein